METVDEPALTADADAALKILRKHASWKETRDLQDASVTHSDAQYIGEYYRLKYDATLRSTTHEE
ncbi:hypothetical protein FIBSPDRAFT_955015 [Athelia psychrophila]|uniref:Uncharacterized protein n=1 Tax=Athelia psychrophila TaxID=1759441 RepID=A0A166ILM9_9AGAM|nr:hypothetical protein FIBSPDRAFT_955015 [Fibularhizoctonia sp. CBS 109695]